MSEEVMIASADMRIIAELQAQLASAREALLLSEADSEAFAATLTAFFRAPSFEESGRLRVELRKLARVDHPGQALADEVTAARAENAILKQALDQIDRHVVGACEGDFSDMPEPCEECGEMREIASQALANVKASTL